MRERAQASRTGDGDLRLRHGPIEILARAEGAPDEVARAYAQACARFEGLLESLVAELPVLRKPVVPGPCPLSGVVASAMWAATRPHLPAFVTPMAAVAGAVADAVLAATIEGRRLVRASVNNGGDIALHLAPGAEPWRIGIVVDPAAPRSPAILTIAPQDAVRGVATSGRHGRSHSLGIADSVTVLARDAARADAAATLIANAVDLPGHPAIARAPAHTLAPDSDLGARAVTIGVGPLAPAEIARALDAGEAHAETLFARGLVEAAVLVLGSSVRIVGDPRLDEDVPTLSAPRGAYLRGSMPWTRSPSARSS